MRWFFGTILLAAGGVLSALSGFVLFVDGIIEFIRWVNNIHLPLISVIALICAASAAASLVGYFLIPKDVR